MTLTTPGLSRQARPPLAERAFILATDLDGTFLGGSRDDRRQLYSWIDANRETVGLIFVTGRDPRFIGELCDETWIPTPEYAVGDVGTTIAEVVHGEVQPIEPLEADIAARWNDSGARVRAALDGHPGLVEQRTAFRYRVSYNMDPAAYDASAEDKVDALGLDHLISDNRFLDVLPRGVSKGPSILRLIGHLGIAPERVLVAGDTLNDLSMLETGLNAVAVGGSEAALLERVADRTTVHKAEAVGAGGILEAIASFGLHPLPQGA